MSEGIQTRTRTRRSSVNLKDFVLAWQDMEEVKDSEGKPVIDAATGKVKTRKMGKVNTLEDFCKITGMSPDSATSRASHIRTQKQIPLRSLARTANGGSKKGGNVDYLRALIDCQTPETSGENEQAAEQPQTDETA